MAYGSERSAINAGQLIHKEMTGQLTEAEQMELSRWLDANPGNRRLYEQIKGSGEQKILLDELKRYDSAASLDKLLLRLKPKPAIQMKAVWMGIAAILLISLSIGLGFYLRNQTTEPGPLTSRYGGDVLPGRNRATLMLADGRTIDLDRAEDGLLARQQGISISKSEDGITYEAQSSDDLASASTVGFNTISTPRGGQYRVILPDGSTVWLNAASSLRYPAAFDTHERKVELTGEAYFEVAQDSAHPFIVAAGKQTVEVLGTQFNISSYINDLAIKTTLLEGSVKVIGAGGTTKVLKPGQQSSMTADKMIVENIDTELAVAWKNNQFMFESESIENIMKMVERWYNVEVEYVGEIPDDRFGGTVSKFDNVSNVLSILELTGKVHFKVEGRKIYVSK